MSIHIETEPPFQGLGPDQVLTAIESSGHFCNGHLLALNSYENRVYQIGLEEGGFLVAKFYRPGRWSNAAILEEHEFTLDLAAQEIPVVAPLQNEKGETLLSYQGFRFALYPRRGGRAPELDNTEHLRWLGRFLGRIHALGAVGRFQARPRLDIASFGEQSISYILQTDFLPDYLRQSYQRVSEEVLLRVRRAFEQTGPYREIRLHGDCHPGNILWTDKGPHFVDFDDSRMGPAIQDLWMLLSGDRQSMAEQFQVLLEGYLDFHDFDYSQLNLIEALRALRIMHYAAWLARRWHDPAFPQSFPWFDSPRYWEEHIQTLQEQMAILDEPALSLN